MVSHETTVNHNLRNIAAGIKFIPAENFMGHLFGHDLFKVIPQLEMGQKSLKNKLRRRRSRRSKTWTQVRFFYLFRKFADFGREEFWPYFLTKPPHRQIPPNTAEICVLKLDKCALLKCALSQEQSLELLKGDSITQQLCCGQILGRWVERHIAVVCRILWPLSAKTFLH